MYERFYGLSERPFDLSPNPRFLVLTPQHREALSNVEYGISSRKGITLLLGEAGTGKTTLLRKALAHRLQTGQRPDRGLLYLSNPLLTRGEFFQALAGGFGLSPECAASKTLLLGELEAVLRDRQAQGRIAALVVDEAQALPSGLLEELRLLVNIESDTDKYLPVVLAGQPELADRLNTPGLRQLKQRIALRCHLAPLSLHETGCYVAARVRLAGGDAGRVFTRDAIIAVHKGSAGIPRVINVLCDNALLAGFAIDQRPVDADTVRDVCRDFDLGPADEPDAVEPPREGAWPPARAASALRMRTRTGA